MDVLKKYNPSIQSNSMKIDVDYYSDIVIAM